MTGDTCPPNGLFDLAEPHILRRALHHFYASAAASDAPEIHRLATTIETWLSGDRSSDPHRPLQRLLRGLRPARETPGPHRLRLPQSDQPTRRIRIRSACTADTGRYQPATTTDHPVKCDEPVRLGDQTAV